MKYFLSLLLSISSLFICAQNFYFFSPKQGLPSNLIYQVAQDTTGFLWIATPRGVSRFDGETFKTYTTKNGFPTNDIFSIAISRDNKVWTGTKSKFQGYIKSDSVHLFPIKNNQSVTGAYSHIHGDKFGFSHSNHRGNRYLLIDKTWEPVASYSHRSRGSVLPDSGSTINDADYIFMPIFGFSIRLANDSSLERYTPDDEYISTIPLSQKIPDLKRRYLFLSDSLFSYFYPDKYFQIDILTGQSTLKYFKDIFPKIDSLTNPSYTYFNNETYTCFKNASMVFNRYGELMNGFHFSKDIGQKFISLDHWGNAWAIGNSIGLGYLDQSLIKNSYLLEGQNIRSLLYQNDSLYIATYQDALYSLNTKTQKLKTRFHYSEIFYQLKEGFYPNEIMALSSDQFGSVNFSNHYPSFTTVKIEHAAYKSFCFHKNSLFISNHIGIIKYDKFRKKIHKFVFISDITSLESFNSNLYAGCTSGLKIWEKDTLVHTSISGIPENIKVKKLKKYFSKYLLVATEGFGIYAIDGKQHFEIPATKNLIVDNIFIENDTTLWLATQEGIKLIRFKPENVSESYIVSSFFECDGLLSDRVNDIVVKDSLIYVATDVGLSVLNKRFITHSKAPPLYINEILSGNQKLKTEEIRLAYGSSPLIVKYGVICFTGREHLDFAYQLSDDEWIPTSSQELNFNELQPGVHKLQIKVTDHHNNFSSKTLLIHITPLWWQTSWFKIALILTILLVLFVSYRFTKNRITKREKSKADFERKLSGLELMALRSQMNPHFVFNSLSAIQYFITENQLDLSEKYLVKFSKLIRLFFEYSRVRSLSLKEEIELLENYLTIEKMRFGNKLDFGILIDDNLNIEETHIPSMLLQPLVENAVNHGLFHKKSNGYIEIEFLYNHNHGFDVFIKDDGVGMKKAIEIRKSSKQNYRSSSTQVIKENILLLNQQGEWLINYKTNNRYPKQEDSGTVVHLNFKLKPKPYENQNSSN